MNSFATAFGPGQMEKSSFISDETMSTNDQKSEASQFSNVDLDQQVNSSPNPPDSEHSSYVSLSDAATFHAEPVVPSSHNSRKPPSSSNDSNSNFNRHMISTSISPDRRISVPDMSKLSASSVAAVAAVAPTIDKFKQWSRSAYKCTKQSIYEKLGKTTKTIDAELDGQIEVNQ